MNHRQLLIPVLSAAACIVFAFTFVWLLNGEQPHASTSGEHLLLSRLAPNEAIVVSKAFGGTGVTPVHDYHFGIDGDSRKFAVMNVPFSQNGTKLEGPHPVIATGTLTASQADGLEMLLSYFRARRVEHGFDLGYYDITYFRDGQKIGHEHFTGFWLPDQFDYLRKIGPPGDPHLEADYSRLARESGFERGRMNRLTTFSMLEEAP